MTRRRVLVVRSGGIPFPPADGSAAVEVVEKISHTLEGVDPPAGAFAGSSDLAIFTSQVAVERVSGDPRLTSLYSRAISGGSVAAVGPATAEALRARGIEPSLVASGSGEALLDRLPKRLDGRRVLLPCGEDSTEELPESLRLRGARVERVVVYRKVPRPREPDLEREIVERPFAAFCATSPSAARWLFEGLAESATDRLRETPAVVLGPFTRRYLESLGVESIAAADEARFASALRLLQELATAPGGA